MIKFNHVYFTVIIFNLLWYIFGVAILLNLVMALPTIAMAKVAALSRS